MMEKRVPALGIELNGPWAGNGLKKRDKVASDDPNKCKYVPLRHYTTTVTMAGGYSTLF